MTRIKKVFGQVSAGAFLALIAPMALAQTTTPTTTPGVPDTGIGGDAIATVAVLAVAALAAVVAAVYLSRQSAAH